MNHRALVLTLVLVGCDKHPDGSRPSEGPQEVASPLSPPPLQSASAAPPPVTTARPMAAIPDVIGCQHVLIAYRGAKNAPSKVTRSKADALKLAEKIRSEMLADKEKDFAAFAKEYSEDPGSADRLGSVGKFKRDAMTPTFSDAAFKLQVNDLSPVTLSPFGYHIIKRFE